MRTNICDNLETGTLKRSTVTEYNSKLVSAIGVAGQNVMRRLAEFTRINAGFNNFKRSLNLKMCTFCTLVKLGIPIINLQNDKRNNTVTIRKFVIMTLKRL